PLDQHDRVLSLRWIAVDPVEGLHLGRVGLVASLALVREVAGLTRSASACGRCGGANRGHAQQIAAPDFELEAIFHGAASIKRLLTWHEPRAGPIARSPNKLMGSIPACFNDLAASVAILRR